MFSTYEQCMKGWSSPVIYVTIRQLQKLLLLNTKLQCMKALSSLVMFVSMKQHLRVIFLDTKERYMKGSSTLAVSVTLRQLLGVISMNTRNHSMNWWSTLAICATIKQGSLSGHKRAIHEGVKYPCSACDHKASSNRELIQHKRAVTFRCKIPLQCVYQCNLCS